jgi:hypothetical protein
LRAMIEDRIMRRRVVRKCLAQLLNNPALLGCSVTLQCRIRRSSCAMTKKQYRTPKVSVGTVKKSIAAIASRWFAQKGRPSLCQISFRCCFSHGSSLFPATSRARSRQMAFRAVRSGQRSGAPRTIGG